MRESTQVDHDLHSTSIFSDLTLWFPSNSDEDGFRSGIYLETMLALLIGMICAFLGSLLMKFYRWITK